MPSKIRAIVLQGENVFRGHLKYTGPAKCTSLERERDQPLGGRGLVVGVGHRQRDGVTRGAEEIRSTIGSITSIGTVDFQFPAFIDTEHCDESELCHISFLDREAESAEGILVSCPCLEN